MLKCFLVENEDPEFHEKIKQPGAMWFAPWYHEAGKPDEGRIPEFLSPHYLSTWKDIRHPLVVRCPNGSQWCVDQVSSNGTGWVVTGEAPAITCTPSIVVPGYHGFLRDGVFTADLEGRSY